MATEERTCAERVAPAATRTRRARGEASRRAILEAALALAARDGVHALNHRAIAAEAGVALASTTYFFASLTQLRVEAFALYAERAGAANRPVLDGAARLVARYGADRDTLQRRLQALLLAFMRGELRQHAGSLAVEAQFLSLVPADGELAQRVIDYRESLVRAIAAVLAPVSTAARTDASLLLGAIHRLELDALRAGQRLPEARARAEIGRLLALILRPPQAPPGTVRPRGGA